MVRLCMVRIVKEWGWGNIKRMVQIPEEGAYEVFFYNGEFF